MSRPLISHRGQPGRWQNTLTGVKLGLSRWAGVEVDVVTTADGVAVLSHDPWLTAKHVRRADGRPIGKQRILVRDLTLAQLRRDFHFGIPLDPSPAPRDPHGSIHDDEHVGPTTLQDVLDAVREHPKALLYLDMKIERPELGLTHDAESAAASVFALLRAAKLQNPLWLEAGDKHIVDAYRRHGQDLAFNIALSFPRFDADQNDVFEVVGAGMQDRFGTREPGREALEAGAHSFAVHRNFVSKKSLRQAHELGVPGIVFGIDSKRELQKSRELPVRFLIIDDTPGVREAAGMV